MFYWLVMWGIVFYFWDMIPPRMILGILSAAALMVSSCSPGTGGGGYGATYGSSYNSSYNEHGGRTDYYGGYGRELPQSPGYSVTSPQKVASRSVSRKTKDRLGHKPGPKNFGTVIIDAGHGGRDTGAMVGGVSEKTLALDVARRLQAKLQALSAHPTMKLGSIKSNRVQMHWFHGFLLTSLMRKRNQHLLESLTRLALTWYLIRSLQIQLPAWGKSLNSIGLRSRADSCNLR